MENYNWSNIYPSKIFKFSWTFLPLPFSIFNKLCSAFRDLLLQICAYICVYTCQNFQTKNKLKTLILTQISCIQQISHILCVKSIQIRSFFLSVFSCIWTEYRDLLCKFPYSVRIQKNTDQKKTPYFDTFHAVII